MSQEEPIGVSTDEYELKARLPDGVGRLRTRLGESGWRQAFSGRMEDRCYDDAEGRLAASDRVLRIRRFLSENGREERAVLAWKGPAHRVEGFKRREELETEIEDPVVTAALLARLGFDRIVTTIDREIEVWEREGVVARIEVYPRMDTLVELEGPPARVAERIGELGLPREAWTDWSLDRFVEAFEERTGLEARLAEEEVHD